jgi:hypothetical protein
MNRDSDMRRLTLISKPVNSSTSTYPDNAPKYGIRASFVLINGEILDELWRFCGN